MNKKVKVVEGLIGFRAWKVKILPDGEPVLQSLIYEGSLWEGPVFEADRLPVLRNEHGIYVYASMERFLEKAIVVGGKVTGFVEAGGQVVLHEDGFRAEKVRIKELALPLCSRSFDHKSVCRKEVKWLVMHNTFPLCELRCELHAGGERFYHRAWTASQLREIWCRRYQCEVLPVPRWHLPTIYQVGDLKLIYDPTRVEH